MNILQINKTGDNNISALAISGVNFKSNLSKVASVTEDVVLVGFSDGNEISYTDIDRLIKARNAGKTIVFAHGNPVRFIPPNKGLKELEEAELDYSAEENEYLEKLAINFGIDGFESDFEYRFYNRAKIRKLNDPIVAGLPEEFAIQGTHSIGIRLSYDCQLIIDNPSVPNLQTNYYLATFEKAGKGRVIYWNVGHCHYGQDNILNLRSEEKQILQRLIS